MKKNWNKRIIETRGSPKSSFFC